jgi:hypothetical protein
LLEGLSKDSPFFVSSRLIENDRFSSYIKHMRKGTLTVIFLLSTFIQGQAQESASAVANGSFSVTSYFNITKLTDLSFGTVPVGGSIIVNPVSGTSAMFKIFGSGTTGVQVTINLPASLQYNGNALMFTPLLPLYNTLAQSASAAAFPSVTGGDANTGTDGNLYVWVGGKVTATPQQRAGFYSGIVQISVTAP